MKELEIIYEDKDVLVIRKPAGCRCRARGWERRIVRAC